MNEQELLPLFESAFGHGPEILACAPGRINLMGRHVDHQGSDVNMVAIDRHVCMAARRNGSDLFHFRNADTSHYPEFEFRLSDLPAKPEGDWERFVDRPEVAQFRNHLPLWCRYMVGAILRFSLENGGHVPGLNILVHGDLAPAAGLSSSSALVLCTVLTLEKLLGWELPLIRRLQLSSEAERITGVKGGSSDPAAMLSAQPGHIVHLGCLPFCIKGIHPLRPDYRIILANSHEKAEKGAGARNEYNWRVGAYRIAFALLRRFHPEWSDRMEHLRDFYPERLGISLADVYRAVRAIPKRISRRKLVEKFPAEMKPLETVLAAHSDPPRGYPLREILLYGMAEMARAREFGALLERGDYGTVGEWIRCSHDGDRVSMQTLGVHAVWISGSFSTLSLDQLAKDAEAGHPRALLTRQTGAYRCSTARVDEMVDICQSVDGCLGAQILGAGLGGSIMALVEAGAEEEVLAQLGKRYYKPRGLSKDVQCTVPGPGAQVAVWPA